MSIGDGRHWDRLWRRAQDVTLDGLDLEIWRNLSAHVPFQGRSVLELGCGRAVLSRLAIDAGAASATLVDSSAEALRVARQLFAGVQAVEFVQQDLLRYRAGRQFDIVLSSGLVEHFRGDQLVQCLRAHADHARDLVAIIAPTSPHPNAVQCRRRRFVEMYGYERPISARRMASLLSQVGLRPLVLRRFFPLYNLGIRWWVPCTGNGRIARRLDRWAAKLDSWPIRRGIRDHLIPPLRRFDRILGGLLLAVATSA
jgi:SAM-dependent methyltransferase